MSWDFVEVFLMEEVERAYNLLVSIIEPETYHFGTKLPRFHCRIYRLLIFCGASSDPGPRPLTKCVMPPRAAPNAG